MPRLLLHEDLLAWLNFESKSAPRVRRKTLAVLGQLLDVGVPSEFKWSKGENAGWKRSSLSGSGGSNYYLYWTTCSDLKTIKTSSTDDGARIAAGLLCDPTDVYARAATYHDYTDRAIYSEADVPARWKEIDREFLDAQIALTPRKGGERAEHEGKGRVTTPSAIAPAAAPTLQDVQTALLELDKLGVSAYKIGKAVDIANTSVSRWLSGKAKPDPSHWASILAVRANPPPPETTPDDVVAALIDLHNRFTEAQIALLVGTYESVVHNWFNRNKNIDHKFWKRLRDAAATPPLERLALCANCLKEPARRVTPYASLCEGCADFFSERTKGHAAKRRNNLLAQGLCIACGLAPPRGVAPYAEHCDDCVAIARQAHRDYMTRVKADPAKDAVYLSKARSATLDKKRGRRAVGMCDRCGLLPARGVKPQAKFCDGCAKKKRDEAKTYKAGKVARGECRDCSKKARGVPPWANLCQKCADRSAKYHAEYNAEYEKTRPKR